ncbi:hypothetical protein [Dictyobacter formicarum]|uniref:Uncharacterized protein n=1 Tax=Dictyobacter formicarum TaxID=2778368 RepID=A0ABQ3VAL3_9CHLR|nr:hypothetical protein [Dictyobacter formicarum]GHO83054.1 hypothetical protein KSZ_10600 [Dictyobacter formicarum]
MKEGENQHSELISQADIDKLFSQLTTTEVDDFYQAYQLWLHRQRVLQIQQELQILREKQAQNTAHMQSIAPSAIALSAIAQLRVHGVDDVDLLDRMLERGEEWLDNTMQLLARCETLNFIQGNYTQWCEHALEGAYEWMWSMNDASLSTYFDVEQPDTMHQQETTQTTTTSEEVTEAQLLQKLMSEEGEEKTTARPQARITRPLPVISPEEVLAQSEAFMPLDLGTAHEEVPPEVATEPGTVDDQHDTVPADTTEETDMVGIGDNTDVPEPVQEATHATNEMPHTPLEDEPDAHEEALQSELAEIAMANQDTPAEPEAEEAPQPHRAEPDNERQLSEPDEEEETQPAQNPPEEEVPANAEVPPVEQTTQSENAATDSPTELSTQEESTHEQLATAEQVVEEEPPEQEAATDDAVSPVSDQLAATTDTADTAPEEPLREEEQQEQVEAVEKEPLQEEKQALHTQWPYVYQESQDTRQTAEPAASPVTSQDHQGQQEQPTISTSNNSAKPHVAADSKTRGLFKRSLDRFRRR